MLFIYFLFVVFIEIAHYVRLIPTSLYYSSPIFFISFFTYYFGNQIKNNKNSIYIIGIISLLIAFYFILFKAKGNYSTDAGIVMNFVYILFPLSWLLTQIMDTDENSLLKKQTFWISFSLLFWAVFFFFRLIPMYWLNNNDPEFLIQINFGFQIITIFSYLLFLRGLFCRI
ncbi:hypothetical protein [Flavobacterium sp. J27]|uniref:hypothetical protein n=1 Tax=Flavobacterium sp. J27 TaxID=2060419 RepID=UPI001030AE77|nr:hypothetical protein [Flavobacterium sp. J27]